MEWFYNGLAGINQADNSIAYKNIIIRPEPVGDIAWVKGSYESPYGTTRSEWKKMNDSFELMVEIPANTTAIVYLPVQKDQKIWEGDKAIIVSKEFSVVGQNDGRSAVKLGSGVYHFSVSSQPGVSISHK
jgi:hypothetical protein